MIMKDVTVSVTTQHEWVEVIREMFADGNRWFSGSNNDYFVRYFIEDLDRVIYLRSGRITSGQEDSDGISFSDFKKLIYEDKNKEETKTFYVTQKQFNMIEEIKSLQFPYCAILNKQYNTEEVYNQVTEVSDREWLDYFSGGNKIKFEVKNLYILHGKDGEKDVYMVLNNGIPDWSYSKSLALTGSYDEMKMYENVFWKPQLK